jgi:predicted Zn-dependent protease
MKYFILIFTVILFSGCAVNSLTGKSQLSLVSDEQVVSMSLTQYKDYISKHKVINTPNDEDYKMVQRVGQRIVNAINKYYTDRNIQSQLSNYHWEYNLVKDSAVNAWCMPGGKIVVYTGILPITKNENALAFVLGHEVSHALLQHGTQRISEGMLQQLGGAALSAALANKSDEVKKISMSAYGIGTEYGIALPFSRGHELEADKFGLIWTTMAGYDPQEAIPFWTRMSSANNKKTPEFMSTHPSDEKRIDQIKMLLPDVIKNYSKQNP